VAGVHGGRWQRVLRQYGIRRALKRMPAKLDGRLWRRDGRRGACDGARNQGACLPHFEVKVLMTGTLGEDFHSVCYLADARYRGEKRSEKDSRKRGREKRKNEGRRRNEGSAKRRSGSNWSNWHRKNKPPARRWTHCQVLFSLLRLIAYPAARA
jgi:hypothetical protein